MHLTALGHRSVARVAGLPDLIHTQLRDRAQREFCAELGLGEPVIVHTGAHADGAGHAGQRSRIRGLRRPPRPARLHGAAALTAGCGAAGATCRM
jgi:DNA-binding LacI/PurR family transcriptional regulator